MDFTVVDLPGNIGCEVVGLDVQGDISAEAAEQLRNLWLERGVILFRGMGTSPEVQLRLSRCFGELEPHPMERFRMPGYPELILLTNQNGPVGPVYEYDGVPIYGRIPWHTDLAFTTRPNAGAILRMVQKTRTGGQTGWLDTAKAYDALDEATKEEIADLEVVNTFRVGMDTMKFNNPGGKRLTPLGKFPDYPLIANPLVSEHPESGSKILSLNILNMEYILGMEAEASRCLLQRLIDHALQPEFIYIHHWENNDMVLWDNRRAMHCAMGHPMDEIRIVHRTTIRGTTPMGRELPDQKAGATA